MLWSSAGPSLGARDAGPARLGAHAPHPPNLPVISKWVLPPLLTFSPPWHPPPRPGGELEGAISWLSFSRLLS